MIAMGALETTGMHLAVAPPVGGVPPRRGAPPLHLRLLLRRLERETRRLPHRRLLLAQASLPPRLLMVALRPPRRLRPLTIIPGAREGKTGSVTCKHRAFLLHKTHPVSAPKRG